MGGLENGFMSKSLRERSPLVYVLVALIPYSKPNLLLSFKPALFFRELEKVSRYKQKTLREAYYRAEQQMLITRRTEQNQKVAILTARGKRKIAAFVAQELEGDAKLMIIFDIPEDQAAKRQKFRNVLKEWQIQQVQKSVWLTGKDYREELASLIDELGLSKYVKLYECAPLSKD